MQKEKQIQSVLTKTGFVFFSLLALAAIWNPASNSGITSAGQTDIEASDAATSVIYDKMFYQWTGVTGIYGLGSYGSDGRVDYTHQSGNIFTEVISGSVSTVNNATRIRGSGLHDIFWVFNNITLSDTVLVGSPLTAVDETYTVASEANVTAASVVYLCWYLTGPSGSVAYYHKASGLLIYAEFRMPFSGYTYFMRYTLFRSNAPNNSPPSLSSGQVAPPSGNTTTVFRFSVDFTDPDNHDPEVVNVVIDGVVHVMAKENATDTNYTDGAIYFYQMPLTNTTHSFFFNASDWRFTATTSVINGPFPVSKLTDTAPTLAFVDLYPATGHVNVNFRFRVNYTDADNDMPLSINVTINGTVVSMTKLDPNDQNYIDGAIYQGYHKFATSGNYSFQFSASDGINLVSAPTTPIQGPIVWTPYPAPSLLFNGAYMNYSGTYNSLSWSGRVNNTFISGNTFQAYHYNSRSGSSTLTVDNRTRHFTATGNLWGTSGYEWSWIFKNVSITDVIPIAMYQESSRNFTITSEATRNRLGKAFICWVLQDSRGSTAYYDKALGLFIEGTFITSGGITYVMYITDTNIPDVSPTTLTGGTVTPSNGDMSTSFVFNVTYTDPDNNHPTYIRLVLNNVSYAMTKQNAADTNYADGCVYRYASTLQNISYSYRFVASDGHYSARDPAAGTISGPEVRKSNLNPAVLGSEYLRPKYVTEWDTYYFRVTYTDSDNIAPIYVNLVLFKDGNSFGTFPMAKETPSDTYYVDGANYTLSRQFGIGNFSYYFTTNDTKFVTNYPSAGNFTDLLITPARTPIFNGLYYNYYIGMYMGYWGEGSVHFTMVNATAYNCSEVRTIYIGSPITARSWSIIDIRTRRILSGSGTIGQQDCNTIWNNTRVGTITNMKSENIAYGYYSCVGSENVTAMSRIFDCWKFESGGNRMCYDKVTGMFIYSFSNVGGGYSITKTITATNMVFGVNDDPVATGGAINNTSIPMNRTGVTIDWTITDTNGGSGTYRVLINGSQYVDWTVWTTGVAIHVPVDTSRGLGTFNYTLQYRDVYGAYGEESHVYVTIIDIPTSSHPGGRVVLANSTGVTIDWVLQDKVGPGSYRVLLEGATIVDWTAWSNASALNIAVNCSMGYGNWNYTIQFNNSRGAFGVPDTALMIVNDLPIASLASSVNNTMYGKNATGHVIPWVITDLVGGNGAYNVSINGSLYVSGTWLSGSSFNVSIDTNRGLGWFNYTLHLTDGNGARGLDYHVLVRVVNLPSASSPGSVVYLQNATIVPATWILTDENGPGQYRVLRNSFVLVAWTAWTNGSGIDIPLDTHVSVGCWNYTIQYNNSAGQFGIQGTVIVTIEDLPISVLQPAPVEATQNTTRAITWILRDRIGAGTFTLYVNGTAHPAYTDVAWVNNSVVSISIDTNHGLGTFNYTLRFVDSNGFAGDASTVVVTIIASQPGGGEDPILAFLKAYWPILLASLAGLVAIIAVAGARRKKKSVATKKGKRDSFTAKKASSYTQPGDLLANSLAGKATVAQSSSPASQPPVAGRQQIALPTTATASMARENITASLPLVRQPAKFYCTACQAYFDIPDPNFETWYSCPTCTSLLVNVVNCPSCNGPVALSKDDHARYKATGLSCPNCSGPIRI